MSCNFFFHNAKYAINFVSSFEGDINTAGSLDRETVVQYALRIIATDQGLPRSRSSATTLLVNLTDVNDNAPVFSQATYTETILEGVVGPVMVAQVNATDDDVGDNGKVTYSITGWSGFRNIQRTIFTKTTDLCKNGSCHLAFA